MKRLRFVSALATCFAIAGSVHAQAPIEYNRDIRPILAENCFKCHGPDSAARKAELRLDRRDDAIASAIEPGKPAESEFVRRILATKADELMPPAASHKKLTAAQKDLLQRWIAAGAVYQPHWSLIAPKRPAPPAVKNEAWAKNPLDRFVLARLEAEGLAPAPEADRRTLARRLSLDLTGLPPEPAVVEAFVNDPAPDAYERLVAKLMATEQWGEHRAKFWLDAARYADTHGIHFDNFREMWSYRDWVINAFNRNLPFDRFTIEQLAGDLLPEPTLDQRIATGFNRCNITTNEGGVIAEEYLVHYTRDRTETVSQVWLGTTANCSTCHDHKFDPLTQREFYEMAAFFNNTTQGAMDGNVPNTPPILTVPFAADDSRFKKLEADLAETRKQLDARKAAARGEFDAWLANAKPEAIAAAVPADGLQLLAPLSEGSPDKVVATVAGQPRELSAAAPDWQPGHIAEKAWKQKAGLTLELPDVGDFDVRQGFTCGAWVKLPGGANRTGSLAARMDDTQGYRGWDLWTENGKVGAHVVNFWPDNGVKVLTKNPLKANEWHHVCVSYDGSGQANGVKVYVDGAAQPTEALNNNLSATTRTTVPFKIGQRHTQSRLDGFQMQDLRVYGKALSPPEVDRLAKSGRAAWLLSRPAAERNDAVKTELFAWWQAASDPQSSELAARVASLDQEMSQIKGRSTIAHVMQEKPAAPMAYILFRGEYDKRRQEVKPDTPDALPPLPAEFPKNRLGFAQWLLLPEHPLTARVTVNRIWQELFGTGLVQTSGDFGVAGELPSHPELLDWLAVEFREGGWDMKKFYTLLVTSATYRQAAATTPAKLEKDPQNRLLSRGPRFRMEAEMIRDYALAVSGLLVPKLGGPSVKPYQPDGVWEAVAMIGSNTRDYRRDAGENLYRRSLYTFWKRSAPPASMEIFNAPSRETCTVRRERTNTPLQALAALNDPQLVEAAKLLAARVLAEAPANDEARLDLLARRILSRPLRADELPLVKSTLAELLAHYAAHADDAAKLLAVGEKPAPTGLDSAALAGWTMLANQLLNLDEALNK